MLLLFHKAFALNRIFSRCTGRCQHEFDPVDLVDRAGTGIVVDGNDIRLRILMADFLDDPLSDNMVRQAAERLCADYVRNA